MGRTGVSGYACGSVMKELVMVVVDPANEVIPSSLWCRDGDDKSGGVYI